MLGLDSEQLQELVVRVSADREPSEAAASTSAETTP